MIPLGDDLPRLSRPRMTYMILAVTWAVWLLVERAGGGGFGCVHAPTIAGPGLAGQGNLLAADDPAGRVTVNRTGI